MNVLKALLSALFTVWSYFVLYQAYSFERVSRLAILNRNIWQVLFPLLVLVAVYLLVYFILSFITDVNKINKVHIWQVLLIIIFSVAVIVIAKSILLGVIDIKEIISAGIAIGIKLVLGVVMMMIVNYVWYGVGRVILTWLRLKLDKAPTLLVATAIGLIIYCSMLLVLSLAGKLQAPWILLVLLLLLVVSRPKLTDLTKILTADLPLRHSNSSLVLLSLVFVQLLFSLADLLSPIPTGYDSLSYYFRLARELMDTGHYVFGQYPMSIELLYGAHLSLVEFAGLSEYAETLTTLWSSWAALFGFFSIWLLGKHSGNTKAGLLAATAYYTMPLVGYFQSQEPKPEVFIAPFFALPLTLLVLWRKQLNLRKLFLISVLLFFSFTIKITSTLGIVAFLSAFFIVLALYRRFKVILCALPAFASSFMLVVLPWLALHAWEQAAPLTQTISDVKGGNYYSTLLIGRHPERYVWNQKYYSVIPSDWVATGYVEDYGRYDIANDSFKTIKSFLPDNKLVAIILKYVRAIWNITIFTQTKTVNFMITPLYLVMIACLPIYILVYKKQLRISFEKVFLVIFSTAFFILWLLEGKNIPWYGMGLFVPLTILSAQGWYFIQKNSPSWVKLSGWSIILITMSVGLLLQAEKLRSPALLGYATGKLSKQEAISQLTKGYIRYADIINADPEIQSGQKKVIISGSYLHYFIKNYYSTTINDLWIDNLAGIVASGGGDYAKAKENFKKLGIKYIIFNLGTSDLEKFSGASLMKKYEQFMDFAQKQLKVRDNNPEAGILLLEVV